MYARFATPGTTDKYSISGLNLFTLSEEETVDRLNRTLQRLCNDSMCSFEMTNGELLFSFRGHNLFNAAFNMHDALMEVFRTNEPLTFEDTVHVWHIRNSAGCSHRTAEPQANYP